MDDEAEISADEIELLRRTLHEAALQIEYLHEKFHENRNRQCHTCQDSILF